MSANTTNTRELYFTIKNSFDNIWNKKDSNKNLK